MTIYAIDPQHTWVLTTDEIGGRYATPAGALTDPRFLLSTIAFRTGVGEATVVLSDAVSWAGAAEAGWVESPGPEGSGWRTLAKDGCRVNVLTTGEHRPGATSDQTLMHDPYLLASWAKHTGTHYYATPGVAAVANLRASFTGDASQPRWRLIDSQSRLPWAPPTPKINAFDYRARAWRPGRRTHKWDQRSSYLAAMAAVELPYRELVPTGPSPENLRCGYYRIRVQSEMQLDGRLMPSWVLPNIDRQGTSWVTQSTLALLRWETGDVEIVDSLTPVASMTGQSGHKRILRPWAEAWRDMIAENPNSMLAQGPWKAGYAEMVGLMNKPGGRIFRPDWRHMIIDHVRASIIRRALRVYDKSRDWPLRINVDAMHYAADLYPEDLAGPLGVGLHMGNMRYEGIDDGKP